MTDSTGGIRPGRGIIPLRPLSAAEILDAPFAAMRRYPGPMLGFGLAVGVLYGGATFAWTLGLSEAISDRWGGDVSAVVGLVCLVFAILLGVVAAGWQTALTADAALGRELTGGQIWAQVKPRLWTLALSSLVAIVPALVFVAFVALAVLIHGAFAALAALAFIPLVWLVVPAMLLAPAVVLEGASVRVAVRRALALTRGHWWRIFWFNVLAGIVMQLVSSAIVLPFQVGSFGFLTGNFLELSDTSLTATVLTAISTTLSYAIATPLFAGVIAVLYLDIRIRTEAFDLTATGAVPQRVERGDGGHG